MEGSSLLLSDLKFFKKKSEVIFQTVKIKVLYLHIKYYNRFGSRCRIVISWLISIALKYGVKITIPINFLLFSVLEKVIQNADLDKIFQEYRNFANYKLVDHLIRRKIVKL